MRGNRRAKHRKKKRSPRRRLPPELRLEQARRSLADGNPRKALELLRQVPDQHGDPGVVPLWQFYACVERARQLTDRGLAAEAAAMRERAARHRATIAVQSLPEPDLLRYLRCLDGGEAMSAYAGGAHVAGGTAAAPDHRGVRSDAAAAAAALSAGRRSRCRQDDHDRPAGEELIVRGDVQRCLVVCPGSLAEQWQDKLYQRFHLNFEIFTNDKAAAARTGKG